MMADQYADLTPNPADYELLTLRATYYANHDLSWAQDHQSHGQTVHVPMRPDDKCYTTTVHSHNMPFFVANSASGYETFHLCIQLLAGHIRDTGYERLHPNFRPRFNTFSRLSPEAYRDRPAYELHQHFWMADTTKPVLSGGAWFIDAGGERTIEPLDDWVAYHYVHLKEYPANA